MSAIVATDNNKVHWRDELVAGEPDRPATCAFMCMLG